MRATLSLENDAGTDLCSLHVDSSCFRLSLINDKYDRPRDAAMYEAKARGRSQCRPYQPGDDSR